MLCSTEVLILGPNPVHILYLALIFSCDFNTSNPYNAAALVPFGLTQIQGHDADEKSR